MRPFIIKAASASYCTRKAWPFSLFGGVLYALTVRSEWHNAGTTPLPFLTLDMAPATLAGVADSLTAGGGRSTLEGPPRGKRTCQNGLTI